MLTCYHCHIIDFDTLYDFYMMAPIQISVGHDIEITFPSGKNTWAKVTAVSLHAKVYHRDPNTNQVMAYADSMLAPPTLTLRVRDVAFAHNEFDKVFTNKD